MDFSTKKLRESLKLDRLAQDISELVEIHVQLAKLELKQGVAESFSRLLAILVIGAVCFAATLMLSLGFAQLLNSLTKSLFLGYFVLGGCHTLILILLLIFRRSLKNMLENVMLKILKSTRSSTSESPTLPPHEKS